MGQVLKSSQETNGSSVVSRQEIHGSCISVVSIGILHKENILFAIC